mgnify:FL=1
MKTVLAAKAAQTLAPSSTVAMTPDQFACEKDYRVAMSVAKHLLCTGCISREEYRQIDTIMAEKFSPVWGSLSPGIP